MKIQNVNSTQFKAKHLASVKASAKGVANNFELYKVTKSDENYLNNLLNNINLKELYSGLKPEDYKLWQFVLNRVLTPSNETMLLLKDGIPCGGIKYKKTPRDYTVVGRVTWPVEVGKREAFAGKVLTLQMFRDLMQDNINTIRTCVCRYNPFDTISKCMELGFRSYGGDDYNELMSVNRQSVSKVLESFSNIVKFDDSIEENDIDLEQLGKSFEIEV